MSRLRRLVTHTLLGISGKPQICAATVSRVLKSEQPPDRRPAYDLRIMPAHTHTLKSPKWAIGYLNGRAKAFRSGNVTVADVSGAVGLALRYGAPPSAVADTLQMWQLMWDPVRGLVTAASADNPAAKALSTFDRH